MKKVPCSVRSSTCVKRCCRLSLVGRLQLPDLSWALVKRARLLSVVSGRVVYPPWSLCCRSPRRSRFEIPLLSQLPSSEPEASSRHRALESCLIFSAGQGNGNTPKCPSEIVPRLYIGNMYGSTPRHALGVKISHLPRGGRGKIRKCRLPSQSQGTQSHG